MRYSIDTSGIQSTERRGSLLIEGLLAIALFAIFATATFLSLLTGQESSRTGSDRVRGVYYTEQGIEIAKSIRDDDFSNLTTGDHGYALTDSGEWIFSGSSLTRFGYKSVLTVDSVSSEKIRITARSDWKHGYHRSGATVLSLEITDWRSRSGGVGDWSNVNTKADIAISGSPYLYDVTVDDFYAYITSSSAGDGIYIYDVSNQNAPFRVSSSFAPGFTAYSPQVYNGILYVITEGIGNEIKAYDVSDPTVLGSGSGTVATYDIPGADRANAMFRKGSTLFVGADSSSTEDEFYVFNISSSSSITLLDSLSISDNPTVNDVFVSGDYAYLATDKDTQEMIVIDISTLSSVSEHDSYNATDVHDGTAARASGTGFYLGRFQGSGIDEYLLVTGSAGTPSPSISDTYGADLGSGGEGTVNGMDIDSIGCYAFLATDASGKELQIRSARYKSVAEETYIDLSSDGQDVYYNIFNDRLYMTTSTGFHIFGPGSGGTCL